MSVSTTATDPVEAVKDILGGYTGWSITAPEVYHQNEVSQADKQNKPDPAIYVWSPTEADFSQFSADNDDLLEDPIIEASIWGLNESDVFTYYRETISLLQEYADDNYTNTEFHHIRPSSGTDNRNEKIAERTDHYIMNVQADVEILGR